MDRLHRIASSAALVSALLLAACTSSSVQSVLQFANISGDYSGTMNDSVGGAGTATGTLAQHGNSAGGAITDVESGGTITAQMSLAITTSNSVSGAMVVDYPGGATCTFKTSGTYNAGTNVLSGTYTAVTNCSGQTGTYSLTQLCHDTVTSSVVHPDGNPKC